MITSKSPRKVMLAAFALAKDVLPKFTCKFSRKDFTLPQLFACLALREHQKKSYRGIEALLDDARHWCHAIGMKRVPDHNTLCRAFHIIVDEYHAGRMLDLLARWFATARLLGRTAAIDSTLYDTHHRSRHYEQRCRHYSAKDKRTANARRSRSAKRTPKLGISADTRSHFILAAQTRVGMGSDAPDFAPLLRATRRRNLRLGNALGDAGFDSHANHCLAREELGIRSLIKTGAGRPTDKPPASRYRRLMKRMLSGSQKGKPYGQRAQVETVNSMMKRNLGDALRARTPQARRKEQLLRVITHNLMLFWRNSRGSRQSRCVPPQARAKLNTQLPPSG